ncbi:MAG: phosphoribulokinase [Candidatus Thiodiazotropha sp. (ex. Lucinisca nassula)]|nr:phosphoribulokinase [Candidatus Thiodiazotropha sp. (ex. Lucinisca nassula)]MBW9273763.1 phosphoribulokinase [Candidatus Thiodiazotropha sp. (ex. Lucinisca nassula)]PUB83197.1 MAG: phosphoribulokinase [gamma proteobacterium symbiont of Ctena orbiculata]PUB91544.1 MAG: phosphoribulokinase [gamma proteobacterium symbiont of Ctena orbiculata]
MSKKHPVVAVTGSSGAGTTTVKRAFEHIFYRDGFKSAVVEGDSFHRYTRVEMREKMAQGLSHFGPEANHFDKIAELFKSYGETGGGQKRYYLHSPEEAAEHNARLGCDQQPGEFTPWETIDEGTDLLFYEGLHGMVVDGNVDVAKYVDLGVGVVPIVNLEWIQKIFRDNAERGYSEEAIVDTIMRRMPDYINHITPQFSRTDINFQRVPTVDTSNPFIARDIPTPDESFVVIRFSDPKKFDIDFPYLLSMIDGSFMSRRNSIVVPGGKMGFSMEIVLQPIIERMMDARNV